MAENPGTPAPASPNPPPTQTEKESAYWSAVDAATARTEAEKDVDRYLCAALTSPVLVAMFNETLKSARDAGRIDPALVPTAVQLARYLADAAIAERDDMLTARGVK